MNGGPAAPRGVTTASRPDAGTPAPRDRQDGPLQVDSQSLLQGRSTLVIAHQGELYRLQLTRQGKLILTK